MQWITVTVADLMDDRAAPLITAAQTLCLTTGQADPVPGMIAELTEELRGMIGFSGKYQLSATANTIPPNLKHDLVHAAVRHCLRRINPAMYSEVDRQDERDYEKRLDLIRQGQYPVDLPDDPLGVAPSTPVGAVGYNAGDCRGFTTKGLRNL